MSKRIKPTLANLEREERAIEQCFDTEHQTATTLREHVYNIKRNKLYLAADCKNFQEYGKSGRLKFGGGKITLGYSQLQQLAVNGEIETAIKNNSSGDEFSDKALKALSKLRVEIKDSVTGEVKQRTHDLDIPKIKSVVNQLLAAREKALAKGGDGNGQITAQQVRQAIERKYGPKEPPTLAETLKKETARVMRLLKSFEAISEMDDDLFADAEEESPGCAKRLATEFSKIASFLRKV